jgi:hypothetical protein
MTMANHMRATRRGFLGTSAAGAAAVTTSGFVPYIPAAATAFANDSANDRPRIGCIGTGSMGTGDAHQHAQFGDILAVCDVDNRHSPSGAQRRAIGQGQGRCLSRLPQACSTATTSTS